MEPSARRHAFASLCDMCRECLYTLLECLPPQPTKQVLSQGAKTAERSDFQPWLHQELLLCWTSLAHKVE